MIRTATTDGIIILTFTPLAGMPWRSQVNNDGGAVLIWELAQDSQANGDDAA